MDCGMRCGTWRCTGWLSGRLSDPTTEQGEFGTVQYDSLVIGKSSMPTSQNNIVYKLVNLQFLLVQNYIVNKSSAVAEMGNHLATVDMGRKEGGCCVPFRGRGESCAPI